MGLQFTLDQARAMGGVLAEAAERIASEGPSLPVQAIRIDRSIETASGVKVPPGRTPGALMNKTEARFARVLDGMEERRLIRGYAFESMKFRMADRTWWTPDFPVVLLDHQVVIVEVKAVNRDGAVRWTDDGAVKAKVVPEQHPFAFFLAAWDAPRWRIMRMPSRNYGHIPCDLKWAI